MTADDSNPIARLLHSLDFIDKFENDYIASLFKPVWLKKDEFFIQTGDPVNKVAFVVKGLLSRYNYDHKDHKIIDQFLVDNQFFSDPKGFYNHVCSFTNIQAITPCHLWTISIDEIDRLKNSNHKYAVIITEIAMQKLSYESNLRNLFCIKDPLQKICRFYDLHPHCWSDIPKRDIACYLNMSHGLFYQVQKRYLKECPFLDIN